jgi:hypothetical protein
MLEVSQNTPKELVEIERILSDLLNDIKHPLNDTNHPYHRDSRQAVNDLMSYADTLRNSYSL